MSEIFQFPANDNCALGIDPVDLKYTLLNIQTDRGNLHGGRLLSMWRSATTTLWHIDAGEQGPSTPIISIGRRRAISVQNWAFQNLPFARPNPIKRSRGPLCVGAGLVAGGFQLGDSLLEHRSESSAIPSSIASYSRLSLASASAARLRNSQYWSFYNMRWGSFR